MGQITIIKQNSEGEETWRYPGTILSRGEDHLVIEAFFDREDMNLHGMYLRQGDRFVETYYFDRWYNIFEIYDWEDDQRKGWYCNISSPATEIDGKLTYQDCALDLLVFPDGRQIILDKDEFEALSLTPEKRKRILAALLELQRFFHNKFKGAN